MYSDVTYDCSKVHVHNNNSLPPDAMIIDSLAEYPHFFSSKKDLAVCQIPYPEDYSEFVQEWANDFPEYDESAKGLETHREQIPELGQKLLKPFEAVLQGIETELKPNNFRMTIKQYTIRCAHYFTLIN